MAEYPSLHDKVVIVTGASRGIGKAAALAFARQGAKVVVAARTEAARQSRFPGTIHETVDEIRKLGGEAIAVRTDVGDEGSVNEMARQTIATYGRIDVLVNNAGQAKLGPLVDMTLSRWETVIRVSLTGPFLCCRAALPQMMKQGGGAIVNISSPAGDIEGLRHMMVDVAIGAEFTDDPPGSCAYGAAKAGLQRFTNLLAYEVKEHNIPVNAIKPRTATRTEGLQQLYPHHDFSRWNGPERYMVKGILFLATRDTSLTGQVFFDDDLCRQFEL